LLVKKKITFQLVYAQLCVPTYMTHYKAINMGDWGCILEMFFQMVSKIGRGAIYYNNQGSELHAGSCFYIFLRKLHN